MLPLGQLRNLSHTSTWKLVRQTARLVNGNLSEPVTRTTSKIASSPQLHLGSLNFVRKRHAFHDSEIEKVTLDKQLSRLLDRWETDQAVDLVQRSITTGKYPNGHSMLCVLERLGCIGDVDSIISLYSMLIQNHLCSEKNYYICLSDAFYNSGRIEDSVKTLTKLYGQHGKFEDLELLFTKMTVAIIRDFPERYPSIRDFVEKCKKVGELKPLSNLWKCHMLAEDFTGAEQILSENSEELKSLFPIAINDICMEKDLVTFSKETVIPELMKVTRKVKQMAYLFINLMDAQMASSNWTGLRESLMKAQAQDLPLHKNKCEHYVKTLSKKLRQDSVEYQKLKDLINWIDTLK